MRWIVYYLGEVHERLTQLVNECDYEEEEIWAYLNGTVPHGFDPKTLFSVKGAD